MFFKLFIFLVESLLTLESDTVELNVSVSSKNCSSIFVTNLMSCGACEKNQYMLQNTNSYVIGTQLNLMLFIPPLIRIEENETFRLHLTNFAELFYPFYYPHLLKKFISPL